MYYGGHGDWMWVGMAFWILTLLALIALVTWLALRSGAGARQEPPRPKVPAARAILDERYARGEIDDEEYRRRRSVLDAD
jgi:putative membrane protein